MKTFNLKSLTKLSLNKLLAVLLTVAVLVSSFSGIIIFAESNQNDVEIWDGSVSQPLYGDGESDNPYLISNGSELAWAIKNGGNGKHYKLTADIYLNDISKINWNSGVIDSDYTLRDWNEISTSFNGNIDGAGHVIYGIYINEEPSYYASTPSYGRGLITKVNGAVKFENLGIDNIYVDTVCAAGAFVGFAGGSYGGYLEMHNCFVGENATLIGSAAGSLAAWGNCPTPGVGLDYYLIADSCYSLATPEGKKYEGIGLFGAMWGTGWSISHCYSVTDVSPSLNGSVCANNYSATQGSAGDSRVALVSLENMKGNDVFTSENKMPNLGSEYLATESYPVLEVFHPEVIVDEKVWDGKTSKPEFGNGEENDPYLISNGSELAWAIKGGGNNKHFKLTSDIYLNDINHVNWKTGDYTKGYKVNQWEAYKFAGQIDGDGHVIYGLYIDENPTSYSSSPAFGRGLITRVDGSATFKNLGIDNIYVDTSGAAAAFVGFAGANYGGYVEFSNCYVGENATLKGTAAGSFVAWGDRPASGTGHYAIISSCYSLAYPTGVNYEGNGLMGAMWGSTWTVHNSYALTVLTNSANGNCLNNYSAEQGSAGAGDIALVTKENMQGVDVLTNLNKMPKLGAAYKATDTYPILKVFSSEDTDDVGTWDGTVAEPINGNGEKDNPYLISNGSELAWAVQNGGNDLYYKLTEDIYLNNLSKIDWATGEVANSDYNIRHWKSGDFSGHINGDGHVIYGLYAVNRSSQSGHWESTTFSAAFIGNIPENKSVTISGLGFDNVYIEATGMASVLVGSMHGTATLSVSESFVGENGCIVAHTAGPFVAWGMGIKKVNGIAIDTSYSLFTNYVTAREESGFIGRSWLSGGSISVKNSYAVGQIYYTGTYNNCYSGVQSLEGVTKLSLENMQGADVLTSSSKMNKLSKKFYATDTYPTLDIFTDEPSDYEEQEPEGKIWSGKTATEFAQGNGLEIDPYIISNGAELALAISSGGNGKYYKLSKDIYLNDVSVEGWETLETSKKWMSVGGFDGYINGDGHIVYGVLFDKNTANRHAGLISTFNSGTIEKLGVRNSYMYATHYAGGIVGQAVSGGYKLIDQCFTDETVTVKYTANVDGGAGGIVGYANQDTSANTVKMKLSNSYSKAVVISCNDQAFRANALIGTAWTSSFVIENCYSVYDAPYAASSKNNTSFLYKGEDTVFMPLDEIYVNVYTSGRDTNNEFEHFTYIENHSDLQGANAKANMSGLDFENIFAVVLGGTPKLKIFTELSGEDVEVERNTLFASGKGTKNNPFVIKTAEHLKNLVTSEATKGKYYVLANDIYVNDTTNANWMNMEPIEWYTHSERIAFAGHFDGRGYTVYGIYSNTEPKAFTNEDSFSPSFRGSGLFPCATGTAEIRNVHIRDSYIKGPGYVGSVVGMASVGTNGRAKIIGCSADESVKLFGESVGGIVGGGGQGVILNYCYFTGKILYAVPSRGNGLVGDLWNKNQEVVQCYSVGYSNYRTIPSNIKVLYGTVKDDASTVITKAQMTGVAAKQYMPGLDWDVWYIANQKTPQLKVVPEDKTFLFTYEGEVGKPWSGLLASGFAGGSGTKEDPYLIETPEQLAFLVAQHYSQYHLYYKINADIVINDASYEGWERNAKSWYTDYLVFRGQLDGAGHIISGLYVEDGQAGRAALFPVITQCATISKLGIVNSTIINNAANGKQGYAAAFVAYVHLWHKEPVENAVMPKISECFADDTVYVEGQYAGGIACGASSPIAIENCFFTGELSYEDNSGGLLGNSWVTEQYPKITSSFCATLGRDKIGMGGSFNGAGENSFNYVYVDGSKGNAVGVTALSLMWMRGDNAKTYMKGLDFDKIWMTVDGGTPVLRCFENSEQYSCKREAGKIEISFSTGEGSECRPIYGYAGYTEVPTLPEPTLYGYEFGGWYCFTDLDVQFDEELFPDFDTILYAKWIPLGFAVDFDDTLDAKFDYNASVEHYRPGVQNYKPEFLHSGLKSMHTLNDVTEDALFLLNYENKLEVGKEYTLHFWMAAGEVDASGNVTILHATHPQYNSDIVAAEIATEFSNLKKGEWKEYEYTFVANTPYLVFKTPAGVELFFDDMRVIPTGKEGDIIKPNDSEQEPTNQLAVLAVGSIIFIAGAVFVAVLIIIAIIIIVIRKKKKA